MNTQKIRQRTNEKCGNQLNATAVLTSRDNAKSRCEEEMQNSWVYSTFLRLCRCCV